MAALFFGKTEIGFFSGKNRGFKGGVPMTSTFDPKKLVPPKSIS